MLFTVAASDVKVKRKRPISLDGLGPKPKRDTKPKVIYCFSLEILKQSICNPSYDKNNASLSLITKRKKGKKDKFKM